MDFKETRRGDKAEARDSGVIEREGHRENKERMKPSVVGGRAVLT